MSGPLVGYQYVVLRCVPRVDRDEFLNVGVVLYSQQADFLDVAYSLDPDRLSALAPGLDLEAVEASLRTLADVCARPVRAGAPGDPPSRPAVRLDQRTPQHRAPARARCTAASPRTLPRPSPPSCTGSWADPAGTTPPA